MSTRRRAETFGALALASFGASAADRQSLDDAWWTGPLLAAGAATLPRGRVLVEPYVFDVISTDRTHSVRTLTYLLYGATDELTVGIIPRTIGSQLSDLTLHAQYRLSQFREGGWLPTTSLVIQQSGGHTTSLALRSQFYMWMPNGRIMRTRCHFSYAAGKDADVATINSSWEYSVTRNWVFALDFVYQHDDMGSSTAWRGGIAPAIEYSWSGNVGVIAGARWFVAGSNSNPSVTPMVAINLLF